MSKFIEEKMEYLLESPEFHGKDHHGNPCDMYSEDDCICTCGLEEFVRQALTEYTQKVEKMIKEKKQEMGYSLVSPRVVLDDILQKLHEL